MLVSISVNPLLDNCISSNPTSFNSSYVYPAFFNSIELNPAALRFARLYPAFLRDVGLSTPPFLSWVALRPIALSSAKEKLAATKLATPAPALWC